MAVEKLVRRRSLLLAVAALSAGCGHSDPGGSSGATGDYRPIAPAVAPPPPADALPAALVAAPLGSPADCSSPTTTVVEGPPSYSLERGCIISFDGTPIVYNLYEPLNPAKGSVYTIMRGPGFSAAADPLLPIFTDAGYAYLAWDPRGFGQSGGYSEIDAPWAEGRDVSELITQVLVGRPEIAVNTGGRNGQPRYRNDSASSNTYGQPVVGMYGGSYGGGIQLSAAAFDNRIKAMTPQSLWGDLAYALFPGNVVKLNWAAFLLTGGSAQTPDINGTGGTHLNGGVHPEVTHQGTLVLQRGSLDGPAADFFRSRSMAGFGSGAQRGVPRIPTFIGQGLADTLFNANQAALIYAQMKAADPDNPVKLFLQCMGHSICATVDSATGQHAPATSPLFPGQSTGDIADPLSLAWFDYYLRGKGSSDGFPAEVVYQDQTGSFHGISAFPTPSRPGPARYASAPLSGTFIVNPVPTGVVATLTELANAAATGDQNILLGGVLGTVFSDAATSALDPGQITVPVITAPSDRSLPIVGIGRVETDITVTGVAASLFFRLLSQRTGEVIDRQTQPLYVEAATTHISLDLAGIAYDLPAGDTLQLQVSTSTTSFLHNRYPGIVTLTNGTVEVPVLGK